MIYYLIINIFLFILFFKDKNNAVKNKWRIKESYLLSLGVLGGGIGGLLGMKIFHHKTKKPKFFIIYILFSLIHPIFLYFILSNNPIF